MTRFLPNAPGIDTRVCGSVSEVGEAAYGRLAGQTGELEHSREFAAYLEEIDGPHRLYAAASRAGHVVAISQAVTTSDQTVWLSRPAEMLASLEQLRIEPADLAAQRSLRAGLGLDPGEAAPGRGIQADYERRLYPSVVIRNLWDCLPVLRHDDDQAALFGGCVEAIERYARDTDARSVTCLNIGQADSAVRALLRARGYLEGLYCAIAEIDLGRAATFGDYLARFTGDTRRGIERERRRFRAAGLRVVELDPARFLPVVVAQEAQNWARYGDPVGFDYLWGLRRPLVARLGPRARLMGAITRDGEVVASGIHLLGRDVYHCFTFGADYRRADLAGAYQAVTFYGAVEAALAGGQRRVNLGFEAYQGKFLRGARLRPMYASVLPLDGGADFTARLLATISERTAAHLDSLTRPRLRPPPPMAGAAAGPAGTTASDGR
jgi:Acetyltransferase (GNAT) domain